MQARQALARERRKLLEEQRRLKVEEKMVERRERGVKARVVRERELVRFQQEIEAQLQKAESTLSELKSQLHAPRSSPSQKQVPGLKKVGAGGLKGGVSSGGGSSAGGGSVSRTAAGRSEPKHAKNASLLPPPPRDESPISYPADDHEDTGNEQEREEVKRRRSVEDAFAALRRERKADEMYKLKMMKHAKKFLSAWREYVFANLEHVRQRQVVTRWKMLNQHWIAWRAAFRAKRRQRQAAELALTLKKEHEAYLKAVRFDEMTRRSKAFLAWRTWVKVEGEKKRLRKMHEQRAKKMTDLLSKLQQQNQQPEPHPEPLAHTTAAAKTTTNPSSNASTTRTPQTASVSEARGTGSKRADDVGGLGRVDVVGINTPERGGGDVFVGTETVNARETERMGKSENFVLGQPLLSPLSSGVVENTGAGDAFATSGSSSQTITAPKPSKRDLRLIENMEKRETERQQRRAAMEERKRQRMEMLQKQKEEEERRKLEEEEEAKRKLVEQKKEEKRLARLAAEQKEREKQQHIANLAKATHHYQTHVLLRHFGITPWRRLISFHHKNETKAQHLYEKSSLLKHPFHTWQQALKTRRQQRKRKAEEVYRMKLEKAMWSRWEQAIRIRQGLISRSDLAYGCMLVKRAFRVWGRAARERAEAYKVLERKADVYATTKAIPRRYLRYWREYVKETKETRWREYRRQMLRERVKEMLTNSRFEEALATENLASPFAPLNPPSSVAPDSASSNE
ncbi:hypothetical protein HK102_013813 [Quaeritorhiza haematococci]|nr:hypothetical protein HK102_013813 [Quaeritorhiza haematococci]